MTGAVREDFEAVTSRHRRELHVHCYRMLASFEEAEDAVQETFLRAWRGRDGLRAGPSARAWLYRIATNVCIDARRRRARPLGTGPAEIPWLQPYPDAMLDQVAAAGDGPDDVAVERETIELVFLAALQLLPARQRAALIARDVLGLERGGDRRPAGDERPRGEQRLAAGAGDDGGAPAGTALALVGGRADG